jgi:D-2-hydroxyacid dehydrogenase (NADP+)
MTDHVLIVNKEAQWYAEKLGKSCPSFQFHAAESIEQALPLAASMNILIGLAPELKENLLAVMPKLQWIHALTTGVDNLLVSSALGPGVVLSNSSGFHGPQMSELAVLLMLSTLRDFPSIMDNQRSGSWTRWPQPLLQDKTACIVGLGSIAVALAARLLPFGMTLTGVSDGRKLVDGFSKIYRRSELTEAAKKADFLIVLVPYSASTHHIIDDSIIAAMRSNAILINLARGGCVDEAAVQAHLQRGTIRAAALDVFATEPLPPDSPLWQTRGLTITPHLGGFSDNYQEQVLPIVIEHLNSWASGGGKSLPTMIQREAAS